MALQWCKYDYRGTLKQRVMVNNELRFTHAEIRRELKRKVVTNKDKTRLGKLEARIPRLEKKRDRLTERIRKLRKVMPKKERENEKEAARLERVCNMAKREALDGLDFLLAGPTNEAKYWRTIKTRAVRSRRQRDKELSPEHIQERLDISKKKIDILNKIVKTLRNTAFVSFSCDGEKPFVVDWKKK